MGIKGQPNRAQCEIWEKDLHRAIDTICDAWPVAQEARDSYGWRRSTPGFSERGYTRRARFDADGNMLPPDPDDQPPDFSDPTGDTAASGAEDRASRWLESAQATILLAISLTPADAQGENRWNGPVDPPHMRQTAKIAVTDLIAIWPTNVKRLFDRIGQLANVAAEEWPPTPKEGAVIGEVKVGGRYAEIAICAECRHPITGGKGDPIDTFRHKPYHRSPCGKTVRKRAARVKHP